MRNKNLLITGGATRIGKEIAIHFSKKGWNIAVHYFKSSSKAKILKKIIEKNSVKVALIKADLKNIKQVEKIIYIAKKKLGTIDCLINNAALFEQDDILDFTNKSWDDHLNINLRAPAILTKDFAKQSSKKTTSNIINIIDQRVFKLTPIFMSYTLSKSALYTLTKTMAMRLSPNIKVNGIAPGPVIKSKRQSIKHFDKQTKSTLLKKPVGTKDICDTVEFLINNNSITGQVIAVDSGQNLTWNIKNGKE
ncbi:SDR family oxidoreductase [bacterium]|nr:SDR family oxidoreductase [bacterium]